MKNHSESASIVAPIAAANMLTQDACPIAAIVPPRISIGTAGTGTPSCVINTLANTAHGPSDDGIAMGKCHTAALLEGMQPCDEGRRHRWATAAAARPRPTRCITAF